MAEIEHIKVEVSDIIKSRKFLEEDEDGYSRINRKVWCPVASAIRRTLDCHAVVNDSDAIVRGFSCNLPFPVRSFIKAFDDRFKGVEPIEFDLWLPDNWRTRSL